jgi:hypothetical protein
VVLYVGAHDYKLYILQSVKVVWWSPPTSTTPAATTTATAATAAAAASTAVIRPVIVAPLRVARQPGTRPTLGMDNNVPWEIASEDATRTASIEGRTGPGAREGVLGEVVDGQGAVGVEMRLGADDRWLRLVEDIASVDLEEEVGDLQTRLGLV